MNGSSTASVNGAFQSRASVQIKRNASSSGPNPWASVFLAHPEKRPASGIRSGGFAGLTFHASIEQCSRQGAGRPAERAGHFHVLPAKKIRRQNSRRVGDYFAEGRLPTV